MENDTRSFRAINITMAGVETGRERFTKDEMAVSPPILYWRCNLTALSQRYNLYFIAAGHGISVYQPQFPFQKLNKSPMLFIPFELANPNAGGYIEPARPHGANHILVGDLGHEEILLAATDSGNIVAYRTRSISEALKDPHRLKTNAQAEHLVLRPFFSYWVFESAWGLAIHRQNRMIAVSANTPYHVENADMSSKISVFAFALTDGTDSQQTAETDDTLIEYADHDAEWHDWIPQGTNSLTPKRDKNYKITLAGNRGHRYNVPGISFVNTAEDQDGSWLLSTDIHGEMKVWHIWRGQCYSSTSFADRPNFATDLHNRREAGWLVAALDSLSFRPTSSVDQFCGHSKPMQFYGHAGESYDISNVVRLRTPGHSQAHPLASEASDEEEPEGNNNDYLAPDADTWSEEAEENENTRSAQNRVAFDSSRSRVWIESSIKQLAEQPVANQDDSASSMPSWEQSSPSIGRALQHENETPPSSRTQAHLTSTFLTGGSEDHDDSEDEDWDHESVGKLPDSEDDSCGDSESGSEEQELHFSPVSRQSLTSASSVPNRNSEELEEERVFLTNPDPSTGHVRAYTKAVPRQRPQLPQRNQAEEGNDGVNPLPFIPILHTTTSHLRIINAPRSNTPHIFCAHMLKQVLPPGLEANGHGNLDRLNMIQQIPDLGIVIIATQIGRCAVCSLTRKADSNLLGIRVDWTLPTKKQEQAGIRPIAPLLGIAVAPVQGQAAKSPVSSSNHCSTDDWDEEHVIDGIQTTFDTNLLLLSEQEEQDEAEDGDDHKTGPSDTKRRRGHQQSSSSRKQKFQSPTLDKLPRVSQERRTWPKVKKRASWRATEHSRRYRLMMTYSDMTVLTYELSRGVEMDDLAEIDVSALELVD